MQKKPLISKASCSDSHFLQVNREEGGQTHGRYSSTASLPMKSSRGRHRQAYLCWIFCLNNMSWNVSVHNITVMEQQDIPVPAESVAERTATVFVLR